MWRLIAALSLAMLLVAACSANKSYFSRSEEALGTSGYYHLMDHISIYYPCAIALDFPGYIVGFEETSRKLVTNSREDVLLDEKAYSAGHTVERLLKTMRYEVPFISQVMRYEGRPYGEGNCTLYSLYHNNGSTLVAPCNNQPRETFVENYDYSHAFAGSWDAIDILKESLAKDVSTNNYSHLIVAVMGLDTDQEMSIHNYNSIISSIRKNAGSSFDPLFVGITWPSFYANRWFDPLWEVLAYGPIADRADILGLSWFGILLSEAIMPLSDKIEITIIGHSFGARAASMGLCVGPAIMRNGEHKNVRQHSGIIHNFIGLAPAFSLNRFDEEDNPFYEDVYYRDYCPKIKKFVFTASSNDGAFDVIFWSDMVGDHDYMLEYCSLEQPVPVVCATATTDGFINGYDASAKISYIDASQLIRYTMPGTKGGGHSDIYRPEIGKLLWTVINGSTQ